MSTLVSIQNEYKNAERHLAAADNPYGIAYSVIMVFRLFKTRHRGSELLT